MTEVPTIQQALAAVMADVRKVGKSGVNQAQRFNFRGIDAVLNHVGPALRDHQVVVRPEVTDLRYERISVGDPDRPKAAVQVLAFVTYEFIGPAGDSMAAKVVGEAIDYGDKGVSKAMSVALRTALIQALALPTGDPEPDAQTYERAAPEPRQAPPQQRKPSAYSKQGNRPAGDDTTIEGDRRKLAALHARLGDYGIGGKDNRDAALAYMSEVIGRELDSSKNLTGAEFRKVMDRLEQELRKGEDVTPGNGAADTPPLPDEPSGW